MEFVLRMSCLLLLIGVVAMMGLGLLLWLLRLGGGIAVVLRAPSLVHGGSCPGSLRYCSRIVVNSMAIVRSQLRLENSAHLV
jgi:hypothetical protein